jgi:neogenin
MQPSLNTIKVTWNPPEHEATHVRSYILGWGKGVPDEYTIELEGSIGSHEIKDLEANSEYVISLKARNLKGDSQAVHDTTKTKEGDSILLEAPTNLAIFTLSQTVKVVSWTG